MRPLMHTHSHDPKYGMWNDSYRTCIASLIDTEPRGVPHFSNFGKPLSESLREAKIWLARVDLSIVEITYEFSTLTDLLQTLLYGNPNAYFIIGGRSDKFITKFVVALGGTVAHDPAPSLGSLESPCEDGMFSVQILVPLTMMKFSG